MQRVCASVPTADVSEMVLFGLEVIVPVAVTIALQPPFRVIVYVKVPDTLGVPLMVTTFPAQLPITPVGKPVTVAPVAPVVLYVIFVMGVLIQWVCAFVPAAEVSVIVLIWTVIVPVAVIVLQPPVKVTV